MFLTQCKDNRSERGILIVEVLVAVAIIAIAFTALLGLSAFSLNTSILAADTAQAAELAQEMIEAVRSFRDGTQWSIDGIGILTIGADYYPQTSGSPLVWQIVVGQETIDAFTRSIVFEDIMRDDDDNIVSGGGTDDPDTKKVTARVSWFQGGRTHQVEIITYIANF